ncbi:MAG: 3-oxoacyl-[acyl-carrier-protein] reductase [Treponema sp.]|nr:3-oxoacyl-[acyl-carrier-protein] reductase [Treponema sp.]MDY4985886.1 3-oxoacyl-[acyl-carrier-protein] reductase [Treponema sp.]
MLLSGKKVLITGSSRGIGKAITEKFLSEGASVWGICTKPSQYKDQLEAMAKENGGSFCEMYANAANAEEWSDVIKSALAASEGFDVLVNNAGITRDGLSFRMKKEDWDSVISINLTSAFLACQIVSSDMIRKRAGSIINMSSIVGVHGQGGQVNYSASKAGLIGLTKSLAKEAGSRGVRVNAIAPGFIETDMTAVLPEQLKNAMLETVPLKRAGKPEDIANAALFLASDLSTYVSGQVLGVDGGMGC